MGTVCTIIFLIFLTIATFAQEKPLDPNLPLKAQGATAPCLEGCEEPLIDIKEAKKISPRREAMNDMLSRYGAYIKRLPSEDLHELHMDLPENERKARILAENNAALKKKKSDDLKSAAKSVKEGMESVADGWSIKKIPGGAKVNKRIPIK